MMRLVKPGNIKLFIISRIRHLGFGFKRSIVELLPIELLVEIFLYCLPTHGFPRPFSGEAPILLGRVCRVWRSVTLTTPQLWTQLSLSSSRNIGVWRSQELFRLGIQEWLRRSGNHLLSIEIGEHHSPHVWAPIFMSMLRPEAHRWKAVRFRTTCVCTENIVDMICTPGQTPMLTDLRFINDNAFQKCAPIGCAPQLSTIHLFSMNTSILWKGRLDALRELRMNPYGFPQGYPLILTQCPLLEILEIIRPMPVPFLPNDMQHYFRRLQTLILDGQSLHDGHALMLLNSFDTPTLKSLAVTNCSGPIQCSSAYLSTFLQRCGTQLRRLKVSGGWLWQGDLVEYLQHTPLLESLSVESTMLSQDLPTLCPLLVHFDILVTQFHTWPATDRTLIAVDTILSRWKTSRLKRSIIMSPVAMRVEFNNLPLVLKHREIIQCIKQGVRVEQLSADSDNWWASQLPLLTSRTLH